VKRSSFAAALSFWNRTQRPTQSKAISFQPKLESLGDRVLPAAGAISGYVYQDLTGNGLSADDTAMSHVLVELYRATNNAPNLNWGDRLVGVQFSGSDGSYSFGNLTAGRYFVTEFTPWGSVQTAPTPAPDYTVNLVAGQQVGGQDFDNFQLLNTFAVRNISFTITSPNGTTTTVKDLRGHTQQGDTVEANFTIAPHSAPVTVSLVSYNAPGSSFNPSTADEQTILAVATGTFGPGQDSLSVQLPNNYYQVDFVVGPAINEFGPAGGTIFYSAQDRLLSADNGGTNALQLGTLSGTVTDTNGNVLAGATVTVTNLANGSQTVATTDSQGNYNIPGLQAGLSYSVTASDSGYASQTADLMLAAGSNAESFSLVPNSTSPQLANLTVTVTDGSGNGLTGVTVSLLEMNQTYVTTANDNGDGTYTITGVEPGTYIVQAIAGDTFGSTQATITLVPGNNSVTLTLSS
jgi:hypothetical protein